MQGASQDSTAATIGRVEVSFQPIGNPDRLMLCPLLLGLARTITRRRTARMLFGDPIGG
jgi:hypothetical protein